MQAAAHTAHQSGARTRFNDRGHEAGKFSQRPAPRRCQFRVNEVDTIKMVPIILHAAVKMRAATAACVTLDFLRQINYSQLLTILHDLETASCHNGRLCEQRATRFPAFTAATQMVVSKLIPHHDLDSL